MMNREQAILEGARKGIDLLLTGKFKDDDPWKVVAAFAYEKVTDVTVGEVQTAIGQLADQLADKNRKELAAIKMAAKLFREGDPPEMTIGEALQRGGREAQMFQKWLLRQ
jgi:hypothetical protein